MTARLHKLAMALQTLLRSWKDQKESSTTIIIVGRKAYYRLGNRRGGGHPTEQGRLVFFESHPAQAESRGATITDLETLRAQASDRWLES